MADSTQQEWILMGIKSKAAPVTAAPCLSACLPACHCVLWILCVFVCVVASDALVSMCGCAVALKLVSLCACFSADSWKYVVLWMRLCVRVSDIDGALLVLWGRTGAALPESLSDGRSVNRGMTRHPARDARCYTSVPDVRLQHVRSSYLRDGYNLRNDLRHTEDEAPHHSLCCRSLCALRSAAIMRSWLERFL